MCGVFTKINARKGKMARVLVQVPGKYVTEVLSVAQQIIGRQQRFPGGELVHFLRSANLSLYLPLAYKAMDGCLHVEIPTIDSYDKISNNRHAKLARFKTVGAGTGDHVFCI